MKAIESIHKQQLTTKKQLNQDRYKKRKDSSDSPVFLDMLKKSVAKREERGKSA